MSKSYQTNTSSFLQLKTEYWNILFSNYNWGISWLFQFSELVFTSWSQLIKSCILIQVIDVDTENRRFKVWPSISNEHFTKKSKDRWCHGLKGTCHIPLWNLKYFFSKTLSPRMVFPRFSPSGLSVLVYYWKSKISQKMFVQFLYKRVRCCMPYQRKLFVLLWLYLMC